MIWKAYELKAYLDNLIMSDSFSGQVEWIGTQKNWVEADKQIEYYENDL